MYFSQRILIIALPVLLMMPMVKADENNYVSKVWVADKGDGTYQNPVLNADYSDPDVCQAGKDYYLTASSFNCVPGLPILHSRDLVNWEIIGYALQKLPPFAVFDKPQHGKGVWAPCIKYHSKTFYIYWGDPDFGIYMVKTKNVAGPWSEPVLVKAGKGLIDPSMLWDDDGKVYLSHAFAGSRIGLNSIVVVQEMNSEGTKVISPEVMIVDGNVGGNHTVEGTKLYKRNGYYYMLSPAGGVKQGWQIAARSRNIYGPYEVKIVMAQGNTDINGPHQGGLVETSSGESWFLHFQDNTVYGRVLHLNPVHWINDWPVMGVDSDGDGCGEPVRNYRKPDVGKTYPIETPAESDEFNDTKLGLQWSWHANPQVGWAFSNPYGYLRLYSVYLPESHINLWDVPNLLLQKLPGEEFSATTKVKLRSREGMDQVGVVVMGYDYSYLSLKFDSGKFVLEQVTCENSIESTPEKVVASVSFEPDNTFTIPSNSFEKEVYLRINIRKMGLCSFEYSVDGQQFQPLGETFRFSQGKWIGAKVGLFCVAPPREVSGKDKGWADVDWFRIE